eukprot:7974548-Lingulodinium_polyedra.AAC.1
MLRRARRGPCLDAASPGSAGSALFWRVVWLARGRRTVARVPVPSVAPSAARVLPGCHPAIP